MTLASDFRALRKELAQYRKTYENSLRDVRDKIYAHREFSRFEDMDAAFEISDIGRGAGHLNFASGRSTRSPDTDYTGRYGFRCVRNPSAVRDILERVRRRNA